MPLPFSFASDFAVMIVVKSTIQAKSDKHNVTIIEVQVRLNQFGYFGLPDFAFPLVIQKNMKENNVAIAASSPRDFRVMSMSLDAWIYN